MLSCAKCLGTLIRDSASIKPGQSITCETCHLPYFVGGEQGRYGYPLLPNILTEEHKGLWKKQEIKDQQIKSLEQVIDSIRKQPIC